MNRRMGRSNQNHLPKLANPGFDGTVRRGSVTCPHCGYTTPIEQVREQLSINDGGTDDARLMCNLLFVKVKRKRLQMRNNKFFEERGRFFRLATLMMFSCRSSQKDDWN